MYRLTIFVLVSCVTSEWLVGAVRRGRSSSGRNNLFFDSYERLSSEDLDESGDDLREAVLMHPEDVLDIPPNPAKRDYETTDFDIEPLSEEPEYPHVYARDSQLARGFIHDLLEQIQLAFSKWPPGFSSHTPANPVFFYQFDSSLLEPQKTWLKVLLATVEEKTCNTIVESGESPHITFMGTDGCSVESVSNQIIIGFECFEPNMILKLILKNFGICNLQSPEPTFKTSGLYLHHFRSREQREAEEGTDCNDKFCLCSFLANGNSSLPCGSSSHAKKPMCSRTCRICGETCMDYDPDCKTHDTLKDCLLDWDQKKQRCANTCGACKNRKDSDICIDYFACCKYYAQRGYCPKYPRVMKDFCPLSCGYCKPKSCVDERNDCHELKRMGGCSKMAVLMEKSCRRTCNLCGNDMKNRDNDERVPPEDCIQDEDFGKKFCSWDPFVML